MGSVVAGYRYFVGMHLGLCAGPVDALMEIRAGDRTVWNGQRYTVSTDAKGQPVYTQVGGLAPVTASESLHINAPEVFGGEEKEGGIQGGLDVMMGEPSQAANSYLVQQHGANTPAYRGLLGIVWKRGLVTANNPYIKPWAFKVRRILQGWQSGAPWYSAKAAITLPGGIGQGMNPAHIVYECLTNADWGLGYGSSLIDDSNFRAAADVFHAEGLGLCIQWTRQQPIEDFVQVIMDHAGAILQQDRSTGLFKLKPLRADYTVGTLPLFDESNILTLDSYQRPALPEAVNELSVTFDDLATGKQGSIAVQNLANITSQGGTVQQSRAYPGLPTPQLAARVAMRDLQVVSTPLAKVRFRASRAAAKLLPGDVIRMSWAKLGISTLVLRVLKVSTGTLTSGGVEIEAVEDVFGLPATAYAAQQPSGWTEPAAEPQPATLRVVREATFYEVQQQQGTDAAQALPADAGFVVAAAVRASGDAMDFGLRTKLAAGATYDELDRGPFCPSGTLLATLGHTATAATLVGIVDGDLAVAGGYAQVGQEIVRVDTWNPNTGAIALGRGVCGTVAAQHAAGARLYFLDGFLAVDETERVDGDAVQVKLTPRTGRGQLSEASAPVDNLTMDQVAARPYAPGRFRIAGQAYPTMVDSSPVLTWAHRHRLQQNLQGDETGNIGPEPGTTYTAEIRNGDTDALLDSATGLTGTSYTPGGLGTAPRMKARLWAVRGGLASAQRHEWTFDYNGPVFAPGATFSTSATLFAGFATNGNGTAQGFSPDIASNNYVPPAQARILRGSAFSEGVNDVLLLLHFNEPNGSTVFTDSSIYQASTAGVYGGAVTTTGPQFGPGAFLGVMSPFPSRVRIGSEGATPTHLQGFFNLPAWTVEGWAYYPDPNEAFAGFEVLDFSAVDGQAQPIGSKIGFRSWTSFQAPSPFITHGTTTTQSGNCDLVPYGQWFHFAFVKFDGKLKCFINGVSAIRVLSSGGAQDFYSAGTSTAPNTSTVTVGGIVGKLDEVRITKFARYADDFTPPAAPFPNPGVGLGETFTANASILAGSAVGSGLTAPALLLHLDGANGATTFPDSSGNNRSVTRLGIAQITTARSRFGGASLSFPGSADALVIEGLNPGPTVDFTAEGWVWVPASQTGWSTFLAFGNSTGGPSLYALSSTSGKPAIYRGSTLVQHQNNLPRDQWVHLAVVRKAGVSRIYLNGIMSTASTIGFNSNFETRTIIGAANTSRSEPLGPGSGVDEFRLIIGQAIYDGDFTPPSAPFPDP